MKTVTRKERKCNLWKDSYLYYYQLSIFGLLSSNHSKTSKPTLTDILLKLAYISRINKIILLLSFRLFSTIHTMMKDRTS